MSRNKDPDKYDRIHEIFVNILWEETHSMLYEDGSVEDAEKMRNQVNLVMPIRPGRQEPNNHKLPRHVDSSK